MLFTILFVGQIFHCKLDRAKFVPNAHNAQALANANIYLLHSVQAFSPAMYGIRMNGIVPKQVHIFPDTKEISRFLIIQRFGDMFSDCKLVCLNYSFFFEVLCPESSFLQIHRVNGDWDKEFSSTKGSHLLTSKSSASVGGQHD